MMEEVQDSNEPNSRGSPFEFLNGKMESVQLEQHSPPGLSSDSSEVVGGGDSGGPSAQTPPVADSSRYTDTVASSSGTAPPPPIISSPPRFTTSSSPLSNPYSVRSTTPRAARPQRYVLPSNPAYSSLGMPGAGTPATARTPLFTPTAGVASGGGGALSTPSSTSLILQPPPTTPGSAPVPTPYMSRSVHLGMDVGGGDIGVAQPPPPPSTSGVEQGVGGGVNKLFGWVKGAVGGDVINKVVEKAKHAGYTTITTLDPQMKQYLRSGGSLELLIGSNHDSLISAITESFQSHFGRATCRGIGVAHNANMARQLVGYSNIAKGCEDILDSIRMTGQPSGQGVLVAAESGLVELTTDRWFEVTCLTLSDVTRSITLQTYSQPTPVPTEYIVQAKQGTPDDYPLRATGLALTIGELVNRNIPTASPFDWQQHFVSMSSYQIIFNAGKCLAGLYDYYLTQRDQQLPPMSP